MSRIAGGTVGYHLGLVAEGFEPAGRWVGRGAIDSEHLGLAGPVDADSLAAVLGGRDPHSGAALRRWAVRTPGVELLFQLPKSVSILWATADAPVAAAVEASRDAALDAAVAYLESDAVVVGPQQTPSVMVGAAFAHRTSRSADPHLHVHLVAANLGRSGAGPWRAVNNLVLGSQLAAAGHLFEAHLRHEITGRLDVTFGAVRHGVAQLECIPEGARAEFSRRLQQVRANAARHGGTSASARRLAALTDRPERHPGLVAEVLVSEWRERATAAGLRLSDDLLRRGRSAPDPTRNDRPASAALTAAQAAEAEERVLRSLDQLSSFSRRDVLRLVCDGAPQGISAAAARRVVDRVLDRSEVVEIAGRPVLRTVDVRRFGGKRVVTVNADRARWTTEGELARQDHVRGVAAAERGRGTGVVPDALVDKTLASGTGLSSDQRRALESLLRSGHGVEVVAAGCGPQRSAVLAAGRQAWAAAGIRVLGAAGTSAAAARFEAETGIESADFGQLAACLGVLAAPVVTPTVIVATDAERYGSRAVAELVDTAARTRSKLVLVADHVSYPENDLSGGWSAVAQAVGSVTIERVRDRVSEIGPAPRTVADAVHVVGDRVIVSASHEALRDRLVADWRATQGRAVMVAASRADVDDLNRRAGVALAGEGWTADGAPDPAATPYQARRRGETELLVWGPPGVLEERPGVTAHFYVVGPREHAAGIDPPAYLTGVLGPLPADAAARERWRTAAGAVERYRQRWGISDETVGLGPPADSTRQRIERREVERRVLVATRGWTRRAERGLERAAAHAAERGWDRVLERRPEPAERDYR